MQSSNTKSYDKIAEFIRELGVTRDIFVQEANILDQILRMLGYGRASTILDAACGTGDVMQALTCMNYPSVTGMDGSFNMTRLAPSGTKIVVSEWTQLSQIALDRPRFDVIYFLGNSLSHEQEENIPSVLKSAHERLNPMGLIVFDLRNWSKSLNNFFEEGRKINVWRNLPKIVIRGEPYTVRDICRYENTRQIISYEFKSETTGIAIDEEVSYAMFNFDMARRWLSDAGFKSCQQHSIGTWPYRIITAQRN